MKKIVILLTIVFLAISCKDKVEKKEFCIDENTLTVKWTAYKTTDKIPVSGKFEKIIIQKSAYGKSAVDAVNNVEFSIPVSSVFTNNSERDEKLKKFFFGTMKDTETIEGKVLLKENNTGILHLTMNGITASLPITYNIVEQLVNVEGLLDLNTWKGAMAIKALNEVCKDLHKGADGVSKTWNEVKLGATIYVKIQKK